MDKTVERIIAQALRKPPKDRAVIAERLISSLDIEKDLDVEIAWQEEVQRQGAGVDKGEVECIPWEIVRQQVRGNTIAGDQGSSRSL